MRDDAPTDSRFTDYQRVLGAQETRKGEMEVTIRFPNLRYMNEFVALRCASDMLELGLFPNAKEITESFACYRAVKLHVPFALSDPEVVVVVVGDGGTPRTAATFAFRTAWSCHSVDPALREVGAPWAGKIDRLYESAVKVEDFEFDSMCDKLVVVLPHSHAPLDVVLDRVKIDGGERHVVALPCCTEHRIAGRLCPTCPTTTGACTRSRGPSGCGTMSDEVRRAMTYLSRYSTRPVKFVTLTHRERRVLMKKAMRRQRKLWSKVLNDV